MGKNNIFTVRAFERFLPVMTTAEQRRIACGVVPTVAELDNWARHSWATIAASLDIPDDTIALALGHAVANSTTSIYIERDRRKIDAANRRVIDWVLYNKRG
jgi:hypothetical protein